MFFQLFLISVKFIDCAFDSLFNEIGVTYKILKKTGQLF